MNILEIFSITLFILFALDLIFCAGRCYHCKKIVWIWNDYYGQKTDIDNMYLSKDKKYGRPYHKKCCHENERLFHSEKWINNDFKII